MTTRKLKMSQPEITK